MAKVTITLEDNPEGGVKCVADPSYEILMTIHTSGHEWTSAQAYAMFVLNQLRKESKNQKPTKILIPRIGL